PRCGGRLIDEYQDDQWLQIGRLLGRLHQVGRAGTASARERLHPLYSTRKQADYLLEKRLVPDDLVPAFRRVFDTLIKEMAPRFDGVESFRIHGDCHVANLIYRPGESFFIIDFDDMVVGPAVQDLWMLLPGPLDQVQGELGLLLEGYESFSPFAEQTLKLIEPLRAMRFIHYLSWCGRQFLEDGETRVDESFALHSYWQRELADLQDQLEVIRGQC
ncbi:MAG: serine/threonine protein kinase, partial [Desulfofustis sp.]|nr:serine/threonine protein kinase [Desulfofustis sp.]